MSSKIVCTYGIIRSGAASNAGEVRSDMIRDSLQGPEVGDLCASREIEDHTLPDK